jgi:hypothetical protein
MKKQKISVTLSKESIDIVKKFYPGEKQFSQGLEEIIQTFKKDYTNITFKMQIKNKTDSR